MFVEHACRSLVLPAQEPLKVLDLCAAPGGKSTLLASLLKEEDLLISNEVIQARASVLAENMSRWGQMNTWVTHNDPQDFARLPDYFDLMLVDAPCTGSGLWRKDAAAIDEWSAEHVKLCSERQKRILADALPALKPGGVLLYATCSYSPEENEQVAGWLCDHMQLAPLEIPADPAWNITVTRAGAAQAPGYRFYPWQLRGEGFFLAAFRKEEAETEAAPVRKARHKGGASKTKDETGRWKTWLDADFRAIERQGAYYAVHNSHVPELERLQSLLRIRKTGTALGKIAGKDLVPDQELALSVHISSRVPGLEVSREEALLFLKKEEIRKDHPVKGWGLVTYEGLGLGWGKWLSNRMNNYYPKNWRIRMDLG